MKNKICRFKLMMVVLLSVSCQSKPKVMLPHDFEYVYDSRTRYDEKTLLGIITRDVIVSDYNIQNASLDEALQILENFLNKHLISLGDPPVRFINQMEFDVSLSFSIEDVPVKVILDLLAEQAGASYGFRHLEIIYFYDEGGCLQ